jgi:hypothetical protein
VLDSSVYMVVFIYDASLPSCSPALFCYVCFLNLFSEVMAKSMDKDGKGIEVTLVNTNFVGTKVDNVNKVDNVVGEPPECGIHAFLYFFSCYYEVSGLI